MSNLQNQFQFLRIYKIYFKMFKYIYNGSYKHTPMDTFIKNIYISYGSCFVKEKKTERELYSLLMSLTKESEKIALIKKFK